MLITAVVFAFGLPRAAVGIPEGCAECGDNCHYEGQWGTPTYSDPFFAGESHQEGKCCEGGVPYDAFDLHWTDWYYQTRFHRPNVQDPCLCQQCLFRGDAMSEHVEGGTVPEYQIWEWKLRFRYKIESGRKLYCTIDGEEKECNLELQVPELLEVYKFTEYCT